MQNKQQSTSTNHPYRYPGVQPFTTGQADVFFGRERDTSELYRMLRREPLVVLYGKSGLGKSSLINAGIIPRCREEGEYNPILIRFGSFTEGSTNTPLSSVIYALRGFVFGGKDFVFASQKPGGTRAAFGGLRPPAETLEKIKPENENSLWYHAKTFQLNGGGRPLLLFDQFEELFSYPEEQIAAFQEKLSELLFTGIPLRFRRMADASESLSEEEEDRLEEALGARIVFAIRSDRMHLLHQLADRLPNILRSMYKLRALQPDDAKRAILLPAAAQGDFRTPPFEWAPAALASLLAFLQDPDDEQRVEGILLQLLCQYFEEKKVEGAGLSRLDASDLGDLEEIVEQYYFEKIASLGDADAQLSARRLIEEGLVLEGENIRLSLHEAQIKRQFKVDAPLLERLVDSRLLRAEPFLRGGYSYELAHDRLVPPVLKARRLRREEEARLKAKKQAAELEETRRRLRTVRGLLAVAVLALVAAGYFGWNAKVQARIAKEKEKETADLLVENIRKDSINQVEKFNRFWAEAKRLEEKGEYVQAIEQYKIAKEFTQDSTKTNQAIGNCKKAAGNRLKFEELMLKAEAQSKIGDYPQAITFYKEAIEVMSTPTVIRSRLKDLKAKLEEKERNEITAAGALSYDTKKSGVHTAKARKFKAYINQIQNLLNKI